MMNSIQEKKNLLFDKGSNHRNNQKEEYLKKKKILSSILIPIFDKITPYFPEREIIRKTASKHNINFKFRMNSKNCKTILTSPDENNLSIYPSNHYNPFNNINIQKEDRFKDKEYSQEILPKMNKSYRNFYQVPQYICQQTSELTWSKRENCFLPSTPSISTVKNRFKGYHFNEQNHFNNNLK